ncbi:MAG: tetratricopeptide repeat protein, partial [Thermoanaerobaculia bacterium]
LELDPFSAIGLTNAAFIAYLAGDDAAAAERIERALEVNPDSVDALLVRGGLSEATGSLDSAIADYRAAVARSSRYSMSLAQLGHALARRGDRAEAEEILAQLEGMRQSQYVSAIDCALINLALGRIDVAFEWIEAALREKSGWLVYLKTDRRLKSLRDDPRYERLLLAVDLGNGQSMISP